MPPPKQESWESDFTSTAYKVVTKHNQSGGNPSMSDMTWGVRSAFTELRDKGYAIVDRRTGKEV